MGNTEARGLASAPIQCLLIAGSDTAKRQTGTSPALPTSAREAAINWSETAGGWWMEDAGTSTTSALVGDASPSLEAAMGARRNPINAVQRRPAGKHVAGEDEVYSRNEGNRKVVDVGSGNEAWRLALQVM